MCACVLPAGSQSGWDDGAPVDERVCGCPHWSLHAEPGLNEHPEGAKEETLSEGGSLSREL